MIQRVLKDDYSDELDQCAIAEALKLTMLDIPLKRI